MHFNQPCGPYYCCYKGSLFDRLFVLEHPHLWHGGLAYRDHITHESKWRLQVIFKVLPSCKEVVQLHGWGLLCPLSQGPTICLRSPCGPWLIWGLPARPLWMGCGSVSGLGRLDNGRSPAEVAIPWSPGLKGPLLSLCWVS